jgi:hypothetical protein
MRMKTIKVKDITKGTFTNEDGLSVYNAIYSTISENDCIILSFEGITSLSSSFLNSSIGEIIEEFGFDFLKNKIKITKYTPQLSVLIQNYIKSYSKTETTQSQNNIEKQ